MAGMVELPARDVIWNASVGRASREGVRSEKVGGTGLVGPSLAGRQAGHGVFTGMKGYTVVWSGQLVSLLGSAMTSFALALWMWQVTGKATPFAIYGCCTMAPLIVAAPLAGALVDRWDRKLTMALSDLGAGLSTIVILVLQWSGTLQVWHLYPLGAFAGFFGAFQFPAFSAATTMMVPKKHYARTSAMRSMAETASGVIAPPLAAVLLASLGLRAILMIDIITFVIAVAVLPLVEVPDPQQSKEGRAGAGSIWRQSAYGFRYIYERKPLLSLLTVFLVVNITLAITTTLRAPMVLARSGGNELVTGVVQSAATAGGLAGSVLMIAWGGPRSRVGGIFAGMVAIGAATALMGVGRTPIVWVCGSFALMFAVIVANSCSQAFWQAKVVPDVQGRVFAARGMIGRAASPLSMVVAGPVVDRLLEPSMTGGGLLGRLLGPAIGTSAGSGLALMYFVAGLAAIIAAAVGYSLRQVREAESLLPDHS